MAPLTAHIRGHNMARGGLEAAVWDLEARLRRRAAVEEDRRRRAARDPVRRLHRHSGFGASSCSRRSRRELAAGYQRIKMKIKPGWDVDVVRQVRERFPAIKLMADANSAYTLADTDAPEAARRVLPDDDRAAAGARRHHRSRRAAGAARRRRSASTSASAPRIMPSRRSSCGPAASSISSWAAWADSPRRRRVHDVAQAAGIPVWCGGMLEAGIGRAHNIALATLPNFVLPGDVSASKRYWKQDIIQPAVETTPRGTIEIRDEPGFGYELDHDFIREITVREEVLARVERAFVTAAARQPQLPQHVDRAGGQRDRRPLQQHRGLQPGGGDHEIGAGGQRRDAGARDPGDAGRAGSRAWCSTASIASAS